MENYQKETIRENTKVTNPDKDMVKKKKLVKENLVDIETYHWQTASH